MTQIVKGGNLPVPAELLNIAVSWTAAAGAPDVDVSALLLDAGGTVRGDADLVFYNQRVHPSGAVQHLGKSPAGAAERADWLSVDLGRVGPQTDRIVVAASCDGGTFGGIPGLAIRVATAADAPVAYFRITDATTETAFVFGEFYRRAGGWKFRAVGQGYASGLAGLATDFGIEVADESPQAAVAPPPPAPAPPVPPAPMPPAPYPTAAPYAPVAPAVPVAPTPFAAPSAPYPAPPTPYPAPSAPPGAGAPVGSGWPMPPGLPPAGAPPIPGGAPPVPAGSGWPAPPAPGIPAAAAPPAGAAPAPFPAGAAPGGAPGGAPGASFTSFVQRGRGNQTVTCDGRVPPGWVLIEIECHDSISVSVRSCDEYGRSDASLLDRYEDHVHARTVGRAPEGRPLTLRVEADTPWVLSVRPIGTARRLTTVLDGNGSDVLWYEGPPGLISFAHQGESNVTVEHLTDPTDEYDGELLINEIGRVEVSAPLTGPGLLKIDADGPWRCAVRASRG